MIVHNLVLDNVFAAGSLLHINDNRQTALIVFDDSSLCRGLKLFYKLTASSQTVSFLFLVQNANSTNSLEQIVLQLVNNHPSYILVDFRFAWGTQNEAETIPRLFKLYQKMHEDWPSVVFKYMNLPLCFFVEQSGNQREYDMLYLKRAKIPIKQHEVCVGCYLRNHCSIDETYPKKELLKPIPDVPSELALELTENCSFDCSYCFNRNSFRMSTRNVSNLYKLSLEQVKPLLEEASEMGISRIRLTGGEPTLNPECFAIARYAKKCGFIVGLNTNSYHSDARLSKLDELFFNLDFVVLSLISARPEIEDFYSRRPSTLLRKLSFLRWLNRFKSLTTRIATLMLPENIEEVESIFQLLSKFNIDVWAVNRIVPHSDSNDKLIPSKANVCQFVKALLEIRSRASFPITQANGIPICAVPESGLLDLVSSGTMSLDGRSRLVVDPRGFIKNFYYIDLGEDAVGARKGLSTFWNSDQSKLFRHQFYLPKECTDCIFSWKCGGGNRHVAKMVRGSLSACDPLYDKHTANKLIVPEKIEMGTGGKRRLKSA